MSRGAMARQVDTSVLPADGNLVPVRDGWLIRRVNGRKPWEMVPQKQRAAVAVAGILPVAGIWSACVAAGSYLGGGMLYSTILVALALSAAHLKLVGRAAGWNLRRMARGHFGLASIANGKDGQIVRITGTVRGPAFESAVLGKPAVLARYRVHDGVRGKYWHEQIRGVDFQLELDGGETVRVSAEDALLVEEPSGGYPATVDHTGVLGAGDLHEEAAPPVYDEVVVGPGDRVDVVGVLEREVDPAADAAPGRGDRLSTIIRAPRSSPLLVRRVT